MMVLFEALGNARLHSIEVNGNIGPSFAQWIGKEMMHSLHDGEAQGRDVDGEGREDAPSPPASCQAVAPLVELAKMHVIDPPTAISHP